MNEGRFAPRAAVIWGAIPQMTRARILANVFCVKCGGLVQIVNFTGGEHQGDLHLKGSCTKCGHEVVRVVEASEIDLSAN